MGGKIVRHPTTPRKLVFPASNNVYLLVIALVIEEPFNFFIKVFYKTRFGVNGGLVDRLGSHGWLDRFWKGSLGIFSKGYG